MWKDWGSRESKVNILALNALQGNILEHWWTCPAQPNGSYALGWKTIPDHSVRPKTDTLGISMFLKFLSFSSIFTFSRAHMCFIILILLATYFQFSSVPQLYPTLCNPMQHARLPCPSPTPGAYSNSCPSRQLCHPTSRSLSSPYPPAFNLSQHQCLFKWVTSHQVAKVLEFQLQHQSFQWIFRTDFL